MIEPIGSDKKSILKNAYLHFTEAQWDLALKEYHRALEIDPDDFEIHNLMGDVYVQKNDIPSAFVQYSLVAAEWRRRGHQDKVD